MRFVIFNFVVFADATAVRALVGTLEQILGLGLVPAGGKYSEVL
jgi:hypothetical protein